MAIGGEGAVHLANTFLGLFPPKWRQVDAQIPKDLQDRPATPTTAATWPTAEPVLALSSIGGRAFTASLTLL